MAHINIDTDYCITQQGARIEIATDLLKLSQWNDVLPTEYYEELEEMAIADFPQDYHKISYSPAEVFDYIVQYEGGIGSGCRIRQLIEEVFNVVLK